MGDRVSDEVEVEEWTPDLIAKEFESLARCVVRLGTVDWVSVTAQDETPASWMQRVTTLVNASGMLGSLAMAAQVTVDDLWSGMIAGALQGASDSTEGASS